MQRLKSPDPQPYIVGGGGGGVINSRNFQHANQFLKMMENDNGETDGNDNGETENTNNHDYSGAGYTNISTILFGTLMCKKVMIY